MISVASGLFICNYTRHAKRCEVSKQSAFQPHFHAKARSLRKTIVQWAVIRLVSFQLSRKFYPLTDVNLIASAYVNKIIKNIRNHRSYICNFCSSESLEGADHFCDFAIQCHEFDSRSSLNFFQAFFSYLFKLRK